MRRQDRLGALQCPRAVPRIKRNTRSLDERRRWIAGRSGKIRVRQRLNVFANFGPALESMLARNYELSVGQCKFSAADFIGWQIRKSWMVSFDSLNCLRNASLENEPFGGTRTQKTCGIALLEKL